VNINANALKNFQAGLMDFFTFLWAHAGVVGAGGACAMSLNHCLASL
jgi:hypothetical protein